MKNYIPVIFYFIQKGLSGNGVDTDTSYMKLWCSYGFLIIACLTYLMHASIYIDRAVTPDAITHYLPYAQEFYEKGFSYFTEVDTDPVAPIRAVSPLTIIWTAFFGGTAISVKIANTLVGIFILLFCFGIGKKLHSHAAGIVCAFSFSMSPFIVRWIPTALSEPPFYFFTFLWLWSTGKILNGKNSYIIIASLSLSFSILTRSVWLYPVICILILLILCFLFRFFERVKLLPIIIAWSAGLFLPILAIVVNSMLFGLNSLSSASGLTLYFGTNILTGGFEPPRLGISYGSGPNPLSLMGISEHTSVAIQMLKERSFYELTNWLLQKISWILFFSPIDAPLVASLWRVFEIILSVIAIIWGIKHRSIFVLLLGFGFVLQLFQTTLALYNVRYSTDGVGLILLLLSAVGFTVLFKLNEFANCNGYNDFFPGRRQVVNNCLVFAAVLFISLVGLNSRNMPKLTVPNDVPYKEIFSRDALNVKEENGKQLVRIDVSSQARPDEPNDALWKLDITSGEFDGQGCENEAQIKYASKGENLQPENTKFYINNTGKHQYYIGTTYSNAPLFPSKDGVLTIIFSCENIDAIEVNDISLIELYWVPHYWSKIK